MAQPHLITTPASSVSPIAQRAPSLAERLWDIDWSQLAPWQIDDDVTVERGSFDVASRFAAEHWRQIFGTGDGRFHSEPMSSAKERFGAEMDTFLFRSKDGEIVGFFCGHPLDWSSYYVRLLAFLPEQRSRDYATKFVARLNEALRDAGVARVEAETAPTNAGCLRALTKLGFIVTSTACSERWGMLVRHTKFLQPELGTSFTRQFIAVAV